MMKIDRMTYVVSIDILMEYKDVLQLSHRRPINPTINLNEAHLVVPEIVIRRLAELEKYDDSRSGTAKGLLKKMRGLIETSKATSMQAVYRLCAETQVEGSNQLFSILPVQKELFQCLPFRLSDEDIDDQTIATTIVASLALTGSNAGGRIDKKLLQDKVFDNVVLLTNDNALAIRAHGYGIKTSSYVYRTSKIPSR